MDEAKAELILAAIDEGHSFGSSDKEGMVSLSRRDGVYEHRAAGYGEQTREVFSDREAFLAFLRGHGDHHYRVDLENHMFGKAHAAMERQATEEARASLEQALAWGHELAHAGLFFAAMATPDRDAEDEARAHLGALDARGDAEPWRYRPFGVLHVYLERALHGVFDAPRYRALDRAWTTVLEVDPRRADALYGRGFARQQLRRWAEAAEDLRAALQALEPGQVRSLAWVRLVDCTARQSLAAALEVCDEALGEEPEDRALQRKRASLAKRLAR